MQQSATSDVPRTPLSPDEQRLAEARQRVAAIKGFYIHLAVFLLVLLVLFLINAATGGPWWVQWVFVGWGIGVLAHALAAFGRGSKYVAHWEERKIREFMERG